MPVPTHEATIASMPAVPEPVISTGSYVAATSNASTSRARTRPCISSASFSRWHWSGHSAKAFRTRADTLIGPGFSSVNAGDVMGREPTIRIEPGSFLTTGAALYSRHGRRRHECDDEPLVVRRHLGRLGREPRRVLHGPSVRPHFHGPDLGVLP